jgi:hypothetical protein
MQKMILCLRREKLKVKLRTLNWRFIQSPCILLFFFLYCWNLNLCIYTYFS